ncbi:MAG: hypothetical protein QW728_05275 [Thermoplasmata archaeon]
MGSHFDAIGFTIRSGSNFEDVVKKAIVEAVRQENAFSIQAPELKFHLYDWKVGGGEAFTVIVSEKESENMLVTAFPSYENEMTFDCFVEDIEELENGVEGVITCRVKQNSPEYGAGSQEEIAKKEFNKLFAGDEAEKENNTEG